jgi:hypothetical protein
MNEENVMQYTWKRQWREGKYVFKKKERLEKCLNLKEETKKLIKFAAVPLGVGFADKKEEGLNNLFSWLGGTFTAEWQIKFTTDGIKKKKKKIIICHS